MKKLLAMLLAALMCLTGIAALAENTLEGFIDEGSYVLQLADPEGDLGWLAASEDESVVKVHDADLLEDTFVVRFDPVADGETTVSLKHYTGIACDQAHTWDLTVKDGAIEEPTGGSYTASPDPSECDPYLLGEWETEDGMAVMTVEKNPGGAAWDVSVTAAEGKNAYQFMTTIYNDCDRDGFVYDKGKYWEVPITDGTENTELGEASVAGTVGIFTLSGDPENLTLSWSDDQRPDFAMDFHRQAEAADSDAIAERFSDTWVTDGYTAEIWFDADAKAFMCNMVLNDDSFVDFTDCRYDADTDTLICENGTRYFVSYNQEKADHDRDVVDTGVTAVFTEKNNVLTCEDSLGQFAGVTLLRLDDAEIADGAAEASELYEQADMDAAIILINAEFSQWKGCEMNSLTYAGDEADTEENRAWLSDLNGKDYTHVMEFLSSFHSPVEGGGAWEADTDYNDYQWWLARTEDGGWELVTWGY